MLPPGGANSLITTKFTDNGIRFHIEYGKSRQDMEDIANNIKPEKGLNIAKHTAVFNDLDTEGAPMPKKKQKTNSRKHQHHVRSKIARNKVDAVASEP